MPYVTFSEAARRDAERLYEFLAAHNPLAANAAMDAIDQELGLLAKRPGMGRPVTDAGNVRQWPVRFGKRAYVLRYELRSEELLLLAIHHSREERD